MKTTILPGGLALATALLWPALAPAHEAGIASPANEAVEAAFDIVDTHIATVGENVVFTTKVRGEAGTSKPEATGNFAGAGVYAYVWPTTLNSSAVGFDADQGIVALAVTFHPDFDDAAKGGVNRDVWHPHWVVLAEDKACGGGLKVRDIPEGTTPKLPETWPGAPILIDSPAYPTALEGDTVKVDVPLSAIGAAPDFAFDGVTAGLRVDANLHAPLLCVANVFKVASGDLSLPGTIHAE